MTLKLPRLQQGFPLVDENGTPAPAFHIWWDRMAKQIETSINDINTSLIVAKEYMQDIANITITADYTGTVNPSSQIPQVVACKRYNDTTNVTTSSTWSATSRNGTTTISMASGTGGLTISAITGNDIIDVTSIRTINGTAVTLTKSLNIYLSKAPPPSTGGSGGGGGSSGTSASVSTFSTFNSSTYATVSAVLTVTVGSAGRVDLSAPLSLTTNPSPTGTYSAKIRWQWYNGTSWVDLTVEGTGSCVVFHDVDTGTNDVSDGSISCTDAKTGLTVGSSQQFRLNAKTVATSQVLSLYGTASAVGS